MALAEVAGGTQAAEIGTEHTLATETGGKTYVLVVSMANLVNGDTVELRLKTKVRTGNSSQLAYGAVYTHAQSELNKYSIPVPANIELIATLKQVAGTGRDFIWALLSLD
ncbi:MAG: hypothetical protein V2A73_08200 [Pseudomonadota bacterium]